MPVVETNVVDAIALGGTCGGALAGPCVILGAVIVGTALYATADSWLPSSEEPQRKRRLTLCQQPRQDRGLKR